MELIEYKVKQDSSDEKWYVLKRLPNWWKPAQWDYDAKWVKASEGFVGGLLKSGERKAEDYAETLRGN